MGWKKRLFLVLVRGASHLSRYFHQLVMMPFFQIHPVVRDTLSGREWEVKAKGVINATGPFADALRKMDEGEQCQDLVVPSSGVHIVLPDYYSPRDMGLLDPATSDGRVIFFLPWVNRSSSFPLSCSPRRLESLSNLVT